MPSAHRDVLSLARVAAHNAECIVAEIERTDFVMARGYAGLLLGQVDELQTWLQRLRDSEPARKDPSANPYTDPLDGRYGDGNMEVLRTALTVEELLEYCRYWNWSRERQKHPHGRWWCSKTISAAQRELLRRGVGPQSWRDGTELE